MLTKCAIQFYPNIEQHRHQTSLPCDRAGARARGAEDYPLVMPIRLLRLLEAGEPALRDRVARLMEHGEARAADTEAAAWTEARVVRPLLALPGHAWTREMVLRAVGVFRTNACTSQVSGVLDRGHEVRLS